MLLKPSIYPVWWWRSCPIHMLRARSLRAGPPAGVPERSCGAGRSRRLSPGRPVFRRGAAAPTETSLRPSVGTVSVSLQPSVGTVSASLQPSVGTVSASLQSSVGTVSVSLRPSVGTVSASLQPSVGTVSVSARPAGYRRCRGGFSRAPPPRRRTGGGAQLAGE